MTDQDFSDKIIQDYRLIEELGRGSYGCSYLGQSLSTNEYVAVKILSKTNLTDEKIQSEIDIQQQLDHVHLLGLDHVIQAPDYTYLIMELCDGGDLFEHVVRGGIRDDARVKSYFSQILEAIEYLHEHEIYHRDIKLENILIQHDRICKVADFGLATRDKLSVEFGCGSTTYLGPEHFEEEDQQEESAPYDTSKSDIWSLGILLLTLLIGKNPWEQATSDDASFQAYKENAYALKKLFPSLTWDCMAFLQQVLEIDPIKRFDIKEMKSCFSQLNHLLIQNPWPIDSKASFDSAIFSQEGTSWSDIVEEDLQQRNSILPEDEDIPTQPDIIDQEDVFIHDQEKESWWL